MHLRQSSRQSQSQNLTQSAARKKARGNHKDKGKKKSIKSMRTSSPQSTQKSSGLFAVFCASSCNPQQPSHRQSNMIKPHEEPTASKREASDLFSSPPGTPDDRFRRKTERVAQEHRGTGFFEGSQSQAISASVTDLSNANNARSHLAAESNGPQTIETGLTDRAGTDGKTFRGSTFKA